MLTLTFNPSEDNKFYGSMSFDPPEDSTQEQDQFYLSLGHGLLAIATTDTEEVCKAGIEALSKLVIEQQRQIAANDTLDKAFDVVS